MNQFLQIPLKLLKINDPVAVLTYGIIDNQKTLNPFGNDVKEPVSCIAFETMHKKYDIRKASAIDAVKTLKDNKFIDYKQIPTDRDKEVFNQYSFPVFGKDGKIKQLYKEVPSSVLSLDLTSKEKGVLIMFYLLSTDTTEIILTDKEMAEMLGMSKRTLQKYIDFFINKGLLFKGKHHYALKDVYNNNTNLEEVIIL